MCYTEAEFSVRENFMAWKPCAAFYVWTKFSDLPDNKNVIKRTTFLQLVLLQIACDFLSN